MKRIFLILIALNYCMVAYTQIWTPMNINTSQPVLSSFFSNADTGYAIAGEGNFLKTVDGGMNWAYLNSGTFLWLYSVFFYRFSYRLCRR